MNAPETYRNILRNELAERCQANSRYSLRAFARDLKLSPARLSRILSGSLGLSEAAAREIAKKLGFSGAQTEQFCNLVNAADSRSKEKRQNAMQSLKTAAASAGEDSQAEARQLELDAFHAVSDWYHFAIVELTLVKGFKNDPAWIASRLGISRYQAQVAIDRLLRLELIEEKRGRLVRTETVFFAGHGQVPNESIRSFNKQIFEKAMAAVTTQSLEERSLGTVTVAVDTKNLPQIFSELTKMRRQFNQFAEGLLSSANSKPNEVYILSLPFFRLTEKEKTP